MRIIAALTDFGLQDPYVGMMKAVAKKLCAEVEVIDLTHEIPKYNVLWGSHVLRISRRYFPKGTVFLGVVDPGVGGKRKAVIIEGLEGGIYVGPDNGLLYPVADDEGIKAAYEIIPLKAGLHEISRTFHGRDIFMPAASLIACGVSPSSLGVSLNIAKLVKAPKYPVPPKARGDIIEVDVLYVDSFGNIVTSTDGKYLQADLNISKGSKVQVSVDGRFWREGIYGETFSDASVGDLVLYEGSYGLLEIGVNQGNAAELLKPKAKIFLKAPAR